jgi:predicted transcriptional regulator
MRERLRRNPSEITYSILQSAADGQRKTRVMYQSSLNLKQLNLYIKELEDGQLLSYQPDGKLYQATPKGRAYARAFEHIRETRGLLRMQEEALSELFTARAKKTTVEARPLQRDGR